MNNIFHYTSPIGGITLASSCLADGSAARALNALIQGSNA